jgi:hypothetical protein
MRKVIFVLAGIAVFTSLSPTPAAAGLITRLLVIVGHEPKLVVPLEPLVKTTPPLLLENTGKTTSKLLLENTEPKVEGFTIGNDPGTGAKAEGGPSTGNGTFHSDSGDFSGGTEDATSAESSQGDKSGKDKAFEYAKDVAKEHAKGEAAHHLAHELAGQHEQEPQQQGQGPEQEK